MRIEQSDVQSALTDDEFEIYYQPLISLESGEICACEALHRWNHPKRGKLLPAEFLAVAKTEFKKRQAIRMRSCVYRIRH